MQVIKDGAVVYDPIDNTGSSDLAALGARYAKGRLDTLDGRFNGYYTKTEVLDLLTGMASTHIVAALPATPDANTYYMVGNDTDGYVLHYYDNDLEHAIVGSYELDISSAIPQRAELPAAGVDYAGKVWQYTGTTQAQYVRGKWYACVNPDYYGWLNTDTATTVYTTTATPTSGAYVYNGSGTRLSVNVASVAGASMTDTNGGTYTRNADADKAIWQWSDLAGGGASSVWSDDLSPSRALASDASGKIAASGTTAAELGHLAGVTSGVQAQLDSRAPLSCDYELITTSDPLQADSCKFNFTKKQATFTRIAERRIFNAYAPDPVGGGNVWGVIEVKQMARSSGIVYIEQTFTRFQGTSSSEDGIKYQYKFIRKGFVDGITDPFTQVEGATVTWRPWRPLDYPSTTVYTYDGGYITAVVRGGMCYLDLSGNFNPRYTSGNQHIIGYVNKGALNPAQEVHGTVQNKYGQPDGEICTLWIQTNGEIKAFTMSDWTNLRGGIVYPINY